MTIHSGKFVLRLTPGLHSRLVARSHKEGQSLNSLCLQLLATGLDLPFEASPVLSVAAPALGILQQLFGRQLLGVVAFGSRISGTATESSDLDLLVVLVKSVPIRRGLYRQWDEVSPHSSEAGLECDPHFVHVPGNAKNAGAVWLEAASSGIVIFDPNGHIKKLMESIRKPIATGAAQRAWSHGHPYWARSADEKS